MVDILGINLHLYGLILGVAILVAFDIARRQAKRQGLDENLLEKAFYWSVGMGIVGARLYHVIDWWGRYYSKDPIKVFYVWQGGLAIWGAVAGGLLGIVIFWYLNKKSFKLLSLTDVAVTGLPLAQAIGRLGNAANGELYGKHGEPLFAYEGVLNIFLFLILLKLSRSKKTKPGTLTGAYLIGYGMIRALLENLRQDWIISRIYGFPTAIIFSIVAVVFGTWLIVRKRS